MFILLGFLLPIILKNFPSLLKPTGFAFYFSFLIKVFQYFIDRSCNRDDLTLNILSTIIGYDIFLLFSKWFPIKTIKKSPGLNILEIFFMIQRKSKLILKSQEQFDTIRIL